MTTLVLGSTGFLGSTVCRLLDDFGMDYKGVSLSQGVDLRDESVVLDLLSNFRPEVVINCASFVGGLSFGKIAAREIFRNNLRMSIAITDGIFQVPVKQLITPISNCTYPGHLSLYTDDRWFDGRMHESVENYGFTKRSLWQGAQLLYESGAVEKINFPVFPNLYGAGDHDDPIRAHALGAICMRLLDLNQEEDTFVLWGSGKPVREWLHVEDAAMFIVKSIGHDFGPGVANASTGEGLSILELTNLIKESLQLTVKIQTDKTRPDGALCKLLQPSCELLEKVGWEPRWSIEMGIRQTALYYKSIKGNRSV